MPLLLGSFFFKSNSCFDMTMFLSETSVLRVFFCIVSSVPSCLQAQQSLWDITFAKGIHKPA